MKTYIVRTPTTDRCRIQVPTTAADVNAEPAGTEEQWTAVAFQSGFENFGSQFQRCVYRKDRLGRVWLSGLCACPPAPSLNDVIFTLPTTHRPSANVMFAVVADGRFARLEVAPDGTVYVNQADSATWYQFVSLDGVSFAT